MKFKLILKDGTAKEFNIGHSTSAQSAISAYNAYLATQDHKKIYACNAALLNLVDNSNHRIKKNICELSYALTMDKWDSEPCPFKRCYFLHTLSTIVLAAQIQPDLQRTNQIRLLMNQNALEVQENFNKETALEAGLAFFTAEEQEILLRDSENKVGTPLEQLKEYTQKFFGRDKNGNTSKNWKPYPQNKLSENIQGHEVHYVLFKNTEDRIKNRFFEKLNKHGISVQMQNMGEDKAFIAADLTVSNPKF